MMETQTPFLPLLPDRLKRLSLSNTQVSDAGLQGLVSLKELQELCLDRTAVTSRGVANLVIHLPHLQVQPPPTFIKDIMLNMYSKKPKYVCIVGNWFGLHTSG